MPATTTRPLFEQIDSWLKEIDTTKTASAKKPAATSKKAGTKVAGPSGMGETKHPSESVDDNTQPEETGARFKENTEDIEKDIGPPSVDSTSGSGGDQDSKQYNIGTTQSAVGEDPSVEDDYKGSKDDPGTTHPADAESTGEKYSSMNIKKLMKVAESRANELLVELSKGLPIQAPITATVQQKVADVKTAVAKVTAPQAAANAGVVTAAQTNAEYEKMAAAFVAKTIKDADLDADLVGSFLYSYKQSLQKKAADDEPDEEGKPPADAPEDMAGGGDPTAGAGPGGGGGDVLSALGAGGMGGGAGAGGPPMGGGGDLAGAAMPPEAAGGMGGGAGGDPGAAGGQPPVDHDTAMKILTEVMGDLGLTPDDLMQLTQGAGAPPGAAPEGAKLATAVKAFKLAGKYDRHDPKLAQYKSAREQIKDYVREICGLSHK